MTAPSPAGTVGNGSVDAVDHSPVGSVRTARTNCRFCGYLCGILATVDDDTVLSVEPDPERFPYDAGVQRGCPRWRAVTEFVDHPARVNHPLKRVGPRGGGQWQPVTWTEALDDIADRLGALKNEFGPETLATSIGGPHATYWPLHRFMNLFGSPNNMGIGQICWNPGVWLQTLTYGWPIENELDPDVTECAVLWGTNVAQSDNNLFWRTLLRYKRTGKPLIVVDPRRTRTAAQATHWLPVRPGTDAHLALGFLHVIITEGLYDHEFVDTWCHGFSRLAAHVAPYTPDAVAEVTGVPAADLVEAARLYAERPPATLYTGRGIDQLGRNTAPTHRALALLRAVTGNVDVPGASHIGEMPDFVPEVELELSDELPTAQRNKSLSADLLLQSPAGYDRVRRMTESHGRRLPMRYLTSVHPDRVWDAMLTDRPYPVRAMVVMGNNPLLTQADSERIRQALHRLELLVALEYFVTPTAMLADYVLPAAGPLERPLFQTHAGIANIAYGGAPAIAPRYDRRPDYYFWRELGRRFGQIDRWPWPTLEEAFTSTLEPAGITWEEFCEAGIYFEPSPHYKHYQRDPDSDEWRGFGTPTGRVELYSTVLEELGGDPLPVPQPAADVATADTDAGTDTGEHGYPLRLLTGARQQPFYASSYRQIPSLLDTHPQPVAEMAAATAARLGLADGARVCVETDRGRGTFTLAVAEMAADVVSIEYGWWDPDAPATEPDLGGLRTANANLMTNADAHTSDRLIGTWSYNGLACRVRPVNAETPAATTGVTP